MNQNSGDEQALIKIQHDWAEARMKGDGSYTRRLEAENCTVVWPDGSIVNKKEYLKSMTDDIVFTEFKIDDLHMRLYGDTGIVVGQGTIKAHEGKQNLLGGKFMGTDTFIKQDGAWKVVASQVAPVLKK
jgi:ketosteroid isomerase-like protein